MDKTIMQRSELIKIKKFYKCISWVNNKCGKIFS